MSLPDYDGSEARKLKERIASQNHMQEGDPVKAASFIYKMVESRQIPTRILLGSSCISMVREKIEQWNKEIETYSSESCGTGISEKEKGEYV